MSSNLETEFPDLYHNAMALYGSSEQIAVVLITIGFSLKVYHSMFGDVGNMLRALLSVAICGMVIHFLPDWMNDFQLLGHAFADSTGSTPGKIHEDFANMILSSGNDPEKPIGFWDVILSRDTGFGEAISYAAVYVASQCVWAISYLFNWVQQLLLIYGIAIAPVFVAFFMLDALKGVAGVYIQGLISLAFWPFGWAIANVFTRTLLDMSVDPDGAVNSHALWSIIIVTLWILFSTVAAPFLVSKLMTKGVNAGSTLLKGFVFSIVQAGAYAVGAGATTHLMRQGSGKASSGRWVAGSAAIGGTLGYATGAMNVSAPTVPAIVGVSAGLMGKSSNSKGAYSKQADEIYNNSK